MSVPLDRLTAHDRLLIEATARRVVELINRQQPPPAQLVDAAALARTLGVSRRHGLRTRGRARRDRGRHV